MTSRFHDINRPGMDDTGYFALKWLLAALFAAAVVAGLALGIADLRAHDAARSAAHAAQPADVGGAGAGNLPQW